jgi:hypothetical protein
MEIHSLASIEIICDFLFNFRNAPLPLDQIIQMHAQT